jgi:hypothetical protein
MPLEGRRDGKLVMCVMNFLLNPINRALPELRSRSETSFLRVKRNLYQCHPPDALANPTVAP